MKIEEHEATDDLKESDPPSRDSRPETPAACREKSEKSGLEELENHMSLPFFFKVIFG